MARLKLDYYKGEDLYSDGDVEEELLKMACAGREPEEMEQADFPFLYHFSKIRENILNWYPFLEGASCLEIGSGCGAVTGLLCRRCGRVVSAELSRRRAQINYERHKDCPNLEIWVGNLNDMQFEEAFDYVILNGVFEYAMSYTPLEDPYAAFLSRVKGFLKPDGVILVAIENRLGLKYFAGAPEDHTNAYFDGIRGYEDNHAVRTFSRSEWEALMARCRLPHYRFYYPYPDYKFPQEIFTDESLKERQYGRPTWNFTKYRMALFDETKLAQDLSAEGVMGSFANSFLIEMSAAPLRKDRVIRYVKLSTDRAQKFAVATILEERAGRRVAVKQAQTPEAAEHLDRMKQAEATCGLWQPLCGERQGDCLIYPFLEEKSLAQLAAEAIARKDAAEVKRLLAKAAQLCGGGGVSFFKRTQKQREQFQEVFGERELLADVPCADPANIDLILDNLFEKDGVFRVIDCEWIFDFPVPVPFILWRAINELYSSQQALESLCQKERLFEEFGIDKEMAEVFRDWGTHFAERYVGANRLLRCSVPEIGISIEEFRRRQQEKEHLVSQLYIDTGNGFSEEEKLVCESTPKEDGSFCARFDLSPFAKVRAVRFDPLEDRPCICRIDAAGTDARLQAANAAAQTPEGDLFLTTDPNYRVKLRDGAKSLTVCAAVRLLSEREALNKAGELLQKRGRRFLR